MKQMQAQTFSGFYATVDAARRALPPESRSLRGEPLRRIGRDLLVPCDGSVRIASTVVTK